EIAFIADTQAKLKLEKIISRNEQNKQATDSLCAYILRRQPAALFLLGDIVNSGSSLKKWKIMDLFFHALQQKNIKYYAIQGNHEYMFDAKKGIENFERHFGKLNDNINFRVIDSVAVVMVNSNFKKLTTAETQNMLSRYAAVMDSLQLSENVKCIIVATHHPPFTNSKIVKPSGEVADMIVPKYIETAKAVLFLSGHAHLLEVFEYSGKHFCVIGGGGGRKQQQRKGYNQRYNNLINDAEYYRYFYITTVRDANFLHINIHGMNVDDWTEKSKELLTVEY
ncbi:MAG: metallophosphoesterase, partial [Prevotellaceae bacterium]|nr:metallophosphoesterase [Prevotellaceae bacterium]